MELVERNYIALVEPSLVGLAIPSKESDDFAGICAITQEIHTMELPE
jgi:hypothetical protein